MTYESTVSGKIHHEIFNTDTPKSLLPTPVIWNLR